MKLFKFICKKKHLLSLGRHF